MSGSCSGNAGCCWRLDLQRSSLSHFRRHSSRFRPSSRSRRVSARRTRASELRPTPTSGIAAGSRRPRATLCRRSTVVGGRRIPAPRDSGLVTASCRRSRVSARQTATVITHALSVKFAATFHGNHVWRRRIQPDFIFYLRFVYKFTFMVPQIRSTTTVIRN